MKNKGCFVIVFFILCMLVGCGKESSQSEETSETVSVIEGTYIVRAEDREKVVLENTADEENTETVTDTEEVTAENTETVEDKNEKPQTTVSDKTDSGNEKPATQEKPSQQEQPTTSSKPTTTTQPTTPSEPVHTHSYSSSVTTKATCTENGVETFSCSCGDSYEEIISATGHDYVCDSEEAATCQSEGCRYYICYECWEASYTETIPKTDHNYVGTVTVEPGCTTTGVKSYACSCGASYTETVAALGHDIRLVYTEEPTCRSKGYNTYMCWRNVMQTDPNCNYEVNSVEMPQPQPPHNYVDGVCTVCGKIEPWF